jgi:hypothetical protein
MLEMSRPAGGPRLRAVAGLSALALAAVGAGGVGLAAAATSGSAATRHGVEHLVIMGASTRSSSDSVIVTGAFTAGGSIDLGANTGKIALDGGSLTLVPDFGPARHSFNSATCLMTISGRGTYTLGHGTRRYAGISGSGRFTVSIRQVNVRESDGKCSATKAAAYQGVITGSGPVTLSG